MYVSPNFKTKKALKTALAEGKSVEVFSPSMMSKGPPAEGRVALEGPHYPAPHSWYATGTMKGGKLVKVS
jgi:hypothetical protein